MSRLDELISELCPDGVEYKQLREVANIQRGVRVVRKQLSAEGAYPVYQNSLIPLGYHNEMNCEGGTTFVICAGAAGDVGFSDADFWAADDCHYCKTTNNLLSKYLYHVLLWQQPYLYSQVRRGSIPRLSRTVLEKIKIPVPPLPVQHEIVRMLDSFTEYTKEIITEFTSELTARKKQYEYYREGLMKIDDVPYVPINTLFQFIRNGFVGTVTKFFTDKENGIRYLEGTNIHNGVISDNEELYVTKEFHNKHIKNELKADDILMVQSGHVGDCAVVGEKYKGANCHALIIMSNAGKCVSKFYVHYFHTIEGIRHLKPAITDGNLKHILSKKMSFVKVPYPSIEEQKRIVDILDRFEALFNDINSNISSEITARQKQYEYYRDKLLTFQEKKHA